MLLSAVLLVAGLLGLLLAAPASAHARFEGSDPAEGAVLTELPGTVVMTYSEAIAPEFVDTAVVPPGGEPVTTQAVADGVEVTVDLAAADVVEAAARAGTWQVVARVVSADGHPVEHTTTFELQPGPAASASGGSIEPVADTLTAGPDPTGTDGGAAPPATDGATGPDGTGPTASPGPVDGDPVAGLADGLPGWVAVLAVLAAVAAAAAALVTVLRRRPPGT